MPEYLAPGVYVEETSFRAKSIEGVSTSTTAFVGPTRRGPVGGTPEAGTPEVITSFGDFERVFGGLDDLSYGLNYLAHAVRAYFDNGGSRLYVVRAFTQASTTDKGLAASTPRDFLDHATNVDKRARLVARFPGEAGNGQVVLRQVETPVTQRGLTTAPVGSLVRVKAAAAGGPPTFYVKKVNGDWVAADSSKLDLTGLAPGQAPGGGADILTISVDALDKAGHSLTYENLGLDHDHPRWIGTVLAPKPARRADSLQNLFAVEIGSAVTAAELQAGLFPSGSSTHVVNLTGGNDGAKPTVDSYKTALADLEKLEDISIVAAPGHSAYDDFQAIQQELLIHVEARTRYRIAVLDTPPQQALSDARLVRSRIDSKYAALYYPWVVVANPLARPDVDNIPREINLPPSGFVCGIYARTDIERGVYKAPANEVVAGLRLRFWLAVLDAGLPAVWLAGVGGWSGLPARCCLPVPVVLPCLPAACRQSAVTCSTTTPAPPSRPARRRTRPHSTPVARGSAAAPSLPAGGSVARARPAAARPPGIPGLRAIPGVCDPWRRGRRETARPAWRARRFRTTSGMEI